MAKRLEVFDTLKGIGILLVVLGHSAICDELHSAIYSFHMPLFFMISGYFYYNQPIHSFINKTCSRLIIPWLFFVLLNISFSCFLKSVSTMHLVESVIETIRGISFLDEDCYFLFRSIWFLVVLFFVGNLYNALNTFVRDWTLHVIVALCFFVGYYLQQVMNIPLFLDTSVSVMLFYHIGASLKSVSTDVRHGVEKFAGVFLFLLFLLSVLLQPDIDFKNNTFPIWCPLLSFPIIVALYYTVKWCIGQPLLFPVKSFLIKCGTYSICILGFHRLFQDVFYIIFDKMSYSNATVQTVVFFIISIPLILILSEVLEKYVPFLIGFKSKTI